MIDPLQLEGAEQVARLGVGYLPTGDPGDVDQLVKRFMNDPVTHSTNPAEAVLLLPARDEAEHVESALQSLLRQDYPGDWRIILVDDHSAAPAVAPHHPLLLPP